MNLTELSILFLKMGYEVMIVAFNGRRTILFEDNISIERVRFSLIARGWIEIKKLEDKSDPGNWRKWYRLEKDNCLIELHNTLIKDLSQVCKTHVFIC